MFGPCRGTLRPLLGGESKTGIQLAVSTLIVLRSIPKGLVKYILGLTMGEILAVDFVSGMVHFQALVNVAKFWDATCANVFAHHAGEEATDMNYFCALGQPVGRFGKQIPNSDH